MLEWFDRLLADGEAGMDRLVEERTQETVQPDFKTKSNAAHGAFNDDDRRTFGKALSAFSNSAGGLLIWGVDCRKNTDGIDCAQERAPISEIERFQSQANDLVGQLLQPKHDGVRVAAIQASQKPDTGYLLVAIERSERRPHRSEAKGHNQYFKRAGSSSFAMEHYDIEDAFRRISQPELKVEYGLSPGTPVFMGPQIASQGVIVKIGLRNIGRVSAKFPYVSTPDRWTVATTTLRNLNVQTHAFSEGFTTFELAEGAIHPGMARYLAAISLHFQTTQRGPQPLVKGTDIPLTMEVEFGCLDARRSSVTLALDPERIVANLPVPAVIV